MNKERIEFLENQIRENAGTATAVFLNKWLIELKNDEWIDGEIEPEKDGRYLCRCKSTNDNYLIDVAQFLQGEWHISNNWDLIEYRKIPKGSDE